MEQIFSRTFPGWKNALPLLLSTAWNQWKDLFVAVKSNVAGFYLFEFKDEHAKM